MSRPNKLRCVDFLPGVGFFRPMGVPINTLREVCLSVEEVEALRLKDLEGLEQEGCAEKMHISRPTFHRVLESARSKIADALVNGKAIRVGGGNFELSQRRFRCRNDGHEWDVPFETLAKRIPLSCPVCSSMNIQPMPLAPFGFRGGRDRGFRGGRGR
jgi:predicted DNA-binding protein (UPF0251 family)